MRKILDFNTELNTGHMILAFIIWPFGAFLIALSRFRENYAKLIFIMFAMLYGFTFIHIDSADGQRVSQEFIDVSSRQGHELIEYFKDKTETTIDIFLPLINVIVSRFSSSAKVLYLVYAFIYFMLLMHSFYLLLKLNGAKNKLSFESALFLILFLIYIRLSAINGVRFWIACFVFVYSIIQIIYYEKSKYLILLFLTPLIHFTYILVIPVLLIYYLLRNNLLYCYILLIITLIIPTFISDGFIATLGVFDEKKSSRMDMYLYEGNVEKRYGMRAANRWVIQFGDIIARWTLSISIFIPKILFKISLKGRDKNMFAFLIVFLSILQFTESSYELHRRFFEVFIVLSLAFLYKLSTVKTKKFKPFVLLVALFLFPQIAFGLRAAMETMNIGLFVSSLLTMSVFTNVPVSIVDALLR